MDTTIGGLGLQGSKYTNTTDHGISNEKEYGNELKQGL